MRESIIRNNIKKLLLEITNNVYLTIDGKYVSVDSKECYDDIILRLNDAQTLRNCCKYGTEDRIYYNGLLKILRKKKKNHPLYKLHKMQLNTLNEATIYKAFVQPFTDVIQTSIMASQGIISSLLMMAHSAITFNPKKIERIISAHENRVKNLENKYSDVLERTDTALTSPDATVAFMFFAPKTWATLLAKDFTLEKAEAFKSFLKDEEPKKFTSDSKELDKETKSLLAANNKTLKSFERILKKFEENKINNNQLLKESEEKVTDILNAAEQLVKDKKATENLNIVKTELENSLLEFFKNLNENFNKTKEYFNKDSNFGKQLAKIKTVDEFKNLISKIETDDDDVINLENFKNEIFKIISNIEKEKENLANPNKPSGEAFKNILQANLFKKQKNIKSDDQISKEDLKSIENIKVNQEQINKVAEKQIIDKLINSFFTIGSKQIKLISDEIAKLAKTNFPFLKNNQAINAMLDNSSNQEFVMALEKFKTNFID
jgi:hypothetical protein